MKSLSLMIVLLSVAFSASAQELKHEAFCHSESVRGIKGDNGSCSLVFSINKAAAQAPVKCTGMFMNVIPCEVTFTIGNYSTIKYSCGADPLKPAVKQTIAAEVTHYNVAALVIKENRQQEFVNDPAHYTNLTGKTMMIDLESTVVEGVKKQSVSIALNIGEFKPLSGIVCK